MYAEAYLEPSRTPMMELLCKNHKKKFILDARLVYRSYYLSDIVKVNFKCHCVLVSPINKTHFALTKKCNLISGFWLLLTS